MAKRFCAWSPRHKPQAALELRLSIQETDMSHANSNHHAGEQDVVEAIVPLMPIVLPVGGALLIFLLAFIAVFMS